LLLAELVVRHTRRHMPTRRVALDGAYLPTTGPAHGSALLAAVVATNLPAIGEEQRELLPRLLHDARRGLIIPRIALRHRLQYDVHGLDRSRHRLLGENGRLVVELDVHGAPTPQILGAVMGAAALHTSGRVAALDAIRSVVDGRWGGLAADVELRIVAEPAWGSVRPPLAGTGEWREGGPPEELLWRGIGPDQRWAMEVLGLRAGTEVERDDVNRRFRRLLRDAHPDSGGASAGAAARISELTEARAILLRCVSDSSEESSRVSGAREDAVAAEG
jgi:hypothetical protein